MMSNIKFLPWMQEGWSASQPEEHTDYIDQFVTHMDQNGTKTASKSIIESHGDVIATEKGSLQKLLPFLESILPKLSDRSHC